MSQLKTYLKERSRQKQQRRRRLTGGLILTIIILILLLFLRECESPQKPSQGPNLTPSSGIKIKPRPSHLRRKFSHPMGEGLIWAEALKRRVATQKISIHRCLDEIRRPQVRWDFQFNPHTGEVLATKFENISVDGENITSPCLRSTLSGPYQLPGRESYEDKFYSLSLNLSQVVL